MNKTVYSQLDTRWSKLPYPNKTYTIGSSGCGCVSVTHLLIETEKYKNYTPKTVQPYMKQFAIPAQGTTHAGIKTALEHYGFKATQHATMTGLFDTLKDRKYKMGILLFIGGSRGGVTWTSKGHYVAFTGYKIVNGKHYFYTKDSGGRKHTGWYCYETQMKGLVYKVWSTVPSTELMNKGTYTIKFKGRGSTGEMASIKVAVDAKVTLPKNKFKRTDYKFAGWSVGKSDVVNMKKFQIGKVKYKNGATVKGLAKAGGTVTLYACWQGAGPEAAVLWARKIAADDKFIYGLVDSNGKLSKTKGHTHCYYCQGGLKAYNCNGFCFAAYQHGAGYFKKFSPGSTKPDWWASKGFTRMGMNYDPAKIKKGDIICCYNGKIWSHVMIAGSGKDVELNKRVIINARGWGKGICKQNMLKKLKVYKKYYVLRLKK